MEEESQSFRGPNSGVIRLYEERRSVQEIADLFGVSRPTFYRAIGIRNSLVTQ